MAGFLFHAGAQALCPHGGTIATFPLSPRVRVGGQPVAVVTDPNQVTACSFNVAGVPQPCVRVQWLAPAERVRVLGQPVVLHASAGLCFSANQFPQGPPTIISVQTRVRGM
jgi:hypothetical protein